MTGRPAESAALALRGLGWRGKGDVCGDGTAGG